MDKISEQLERIQHALDMMLLIFSLFAVGMLLSMVAIMIILK